MYILEILIEHNVASLNHPFTYISNTFVNIGVRVEVNFNRRKIIGYVLDVKETSKSKSQLEEEYGYKLQMVSKVIDDIALVNDELLSLAKTLSQMTITPLIGCLQTMLPPSLKPSSGHKVGIKKFKAIKVISHNNAKTIKQNEALALLRNNDKMLVKDFPYSKGILDNLKRQGLIEIFDKEVKREVYHEEIKSKDITLTENQKSVVNGILSKDERISLIRGVTGSGKTEVYIALTKEMLKRGKQVIMLVPEISLTPMMVNIFKSRFSDRVAILHSRLSNGERYDEYRKIKMQEVDIVVGARSAIFAPLNNIGLIILDEEHDSSYKQESTPRYHTLQVAKLRAQYHKANIVLGSATPSIESYARAKNNIYDLYEMTNRINNQVMPEVKIIDMNLKARNGQYSLLSDDMINALNNVLAKGEQAMLLLNKRGYASFVKCGDCDEIIKCPSCDVTLTYHNDNTLRCHYCEFTSNMVNSCPTCHSNNLKKIGYGTQKIEEEIHNMIPLSRVIRYDYDTTRRKDDHNKLLSAFRNKEGNILLGTQMIAKGLDFEDVTFVGVISADLTLAMPSYKASERTFQLLCQVAGRSGRGSKKGEVMIQTYNSEHYAIKCASHHDYISFYNKELQYRKEAMYPPYCHLLAIIVQSQSDDLACKVANEISNHIKKELTDVKLLGPSQADIYKMQNIYRQRILIKYKKSPRLFDVLKELDFYYNVKLKGKVKMICDFNPYSSL